MTTPLRCALRLVVLTDPGLAAPREVEEVVAAALEAGCRAIQCRDHGATSRSLLARARRLRELTREWDALLFVNDRVDIALAVQADGVHLGPGDLPVAAVRRHVPSGFFIGYSTDDPEQGRRAVAWGADYLGCGTVFPTGHKADAGAVIGPAGVRRMAEAVTVPVVAIGGIDLPRAPLLADTGAAGLAVMGAVMAAPDPGRAVRSFLEAFPPRPGCPGPG